MCDISHRQNNPPRHRPRAGRALGAALALACLAASIPAGAAPGWRRLEIPATGTYAFRYLPFSLPASGEVPAIVFLHGSGSSPELWQLTLQPLAESLQVALLVPRSVENLGFGIGADDVTVAEGLDLLEEHLEAEGQALDPTRLGLAGHSAGAAYAAVLAYGSGLRFGGVFMLSSPYRTVLRVTDRHYSAPLRMYYGTDDPNYLGGSYSALKGQWQRLGLDWEEEIRPGFGHNTWPETTLEDGFAFLLAQRYGTPGGCLPGPTRLCLRDGRFAAELSWRDFQGTEGPGRAAPEGTEESGLFWFFHPDNWELQVKVIDGCALNGRFWVFAGATTNVEYTLTVTDLESGEQRTYTNPLGQRAPALTDTGAFATCP